MGNRYHQVSILSERYLEIVMGDLGNTLLLLLQAPIIAYCVVLVWGDTETVTNSLYFVLALSSVWFGAINACREIVKEKPMFHRERRVGLDPVAYVLSKVIVLSMLGFVQCLCLIYVVDMKVKLPGPEILHFLVLFTASLAGSGLGLALSAAVSTSDRAVTGVPILLLPQILFSDVVMSHEHSSDLVKWIERLTITDWAYEGMKNIAAAEINLGTLVWGVLVMLLMAVFFVGLTMTLVKR
ncbi:MAG: ABC transporter permease [Candidatus Eremiobacterota bacterium]